MSRLRDAAGKATGGHVQDNVDDECKEHSGKKGAGGQHFLVEVKRIVTATGVEAGMVPSLSCAEADTVVMVSRQHSTK